MTRRCIGCNEIRLLKDLISGQLCDECHENGGYDYCAICDEWSSDNGCRHIFWSDRVGAMMGCGSSVRDPADHKESFFAVLDKTGLALELRTSLICGGGYFFQVQGPLIGQCRLRCELGTRWKHLRKNGYWLISDGADYSDRFTDALTEEEKEAMAQGVGWLLSLWGGDPRALPRTPAADALTIKWIDEWLRLRHPEVPRQR